MSEGTPGSFWKEVFDDFEEASALAFGYDERDVQTDSGWQITFPEDMDEGLLLSSWALLQSRYSGERFITIGIQPKNESAVRPLRIAVDEELSSTAYVASVEQQLDDQLNRHPIDPSELRNILELPSGQALFCSTLAHKPNKSVQLTGSGAFSEAVLYRVSRHIERLLDHLSRRDDSPIEFFSHLSESELRQVVQDWNPSPSSLPSDSVHKLFEEQVLKQPSAIALISGSDNISYEELNSRANQLAHHLQTAGAQPGLGVAIFMDRGVQQLVCILAILKAGATYIPLDVGYPAERIAGMLEDGKPRLILASANEIAALDGATQVPIINLDDIEGALETLPNTNPEVEIREDATAYIMFTSGSTGRPKGVEVTHRGIIRLLFGTDYVPLNPDTVVLYMASASFDASTFEIWAPLLHGGICVICPARVPTIGTIGRLLTGHKVNTFWMTSALFNLVITEAPEILRSVKYLIAGGEALSPWHVEKALKSLPDTELINGYGPTENTTFSATYRFERSSYDAGKPIPIGRAIGNSTCYILDDRLRPVSVGVPGELYVGGCGVAKGYVNQPELTRERFLDDPFSERTGARMYKTGDKAYWNKDGLIEFLGRVDGQVKVRGFRIELQEIDLALGKFSGIEQAVTVVYEDAGHGKWLASFLKVDEPESFPVDELRGYASEHLPDYMVPAAIVPLMSLPITPTGKLDRNALPKPEWTAAVSEYAPPENETQKVLAEIWQRLLKVDGLGVDANFFELGGDSLRGVHLLHEIAQMFSKELPLAVLTRSPTIRGLANVIDGESSAGSMSGFRSLQMIQQGDDGLAPLFMIHGGGGNVVVFKEFARNLGVDQPVYAFQWAGWDGRRGHSTIEAMARFYKEELLQFKRQDKYRLGGHCIGGLIAIELARQLQEEGIGIDGPLIVSDCPNIKSRHYILSEPEHSERSRQTFNAMLDGMAGKCIEETEFEKPQVNMPESGLRGMLKRLPLIITLVRLARILPGSIRARLLLIRGGTVPISDRPFYSSSTLVQAAKHYSNPVYNGDVLYFRSECVFGKNMGLQGWWNDPFMGFAELCKGNYVGHIVGGDHNGVLDKPAVASLVKQKLSEESTV